MYNSGKVSSEVWLKDEVLETKEKRRMLLKDCINNL